MKHSTKSKEELLQEISDLKQQISKSKKIEKKMFRIDQNFHDLFSRSNDLIQSVDNNGNFLFVNEAWRDKLGYSEEEIKNINLFQIIQHDSLKHYKREFKKILSGKKGRGINVEFLSKSGNKILLRGNSSPVLKNKKIVATISFFNDITERTKTEEKLKLSYNVAQENLRKLNETQQLAQIGSWELDLITNTLTWSKEVYRLFGLKPQRFAITYEAFLDGIHPDDREMVNKAYTDSAKTKSPYEIEHRLLLKDGTVKYVLERCETLFNDEGIPLYSKGTIQDISEQKKIIEKFSRLTKQMRLKASIAESINVFALKLFSLNKIEDILWEIVETIINKFEFVDCVIYLHDMKRGVLIQKAVYGPKLKGKREIENPLIIKVGEGVVGRTAQTKKPIIVNDISKDKSYIFDTEIYSSEISIPIIINGQVLGVIDSEHYKKNYFTEEHLKTLTTIANLISSRIQVLIANQKREEEEKKSKESEAKFKTISTTATDAIIILNEKAETTFWNNAATKIFGYTSEEALGKDLHTFIVPDRYYKDYKKGFSKFVKTGKGTLVGRTREVTAQKKDGTEFPMEISMSSVMLNGKWNAIGIIRDITERKLESEKYKSLFDSSSDALMVLSENGFIDCNQASLKLYGIKSKEEFLLNQPWNLSPLRQPDGKYSKEEAILMIEQAFQKGTNHFEWMHRRKDGEDFPAEVLLTRTILKGKNVIQARITDISGRRKREIKTLEKHSLNSKIHNALLEIANEKISKNFSLQNFINNTLQTTYNIFKQDRLSVWLPNEKGFYLSGYKGTSENPEGLDFLSKIEFSNYLQFMNENRLLISNDVSKDEKLDELKKYFEVTGTKAMLDSSAIIDGKVIAIICFERISLHEWSTTEINFMRSLSDQFVHVFLRLEEFNSKIKQEKIAKELRQLIDTANAPIFGIDLYGKVNEWNSTAEKITGFTNDEVIGKDMVEEFITKEYQESVKKVFDDALNGKETGNFEFPLYTKEKQRLMVLLNATSRRDLEGEIVGVIGIGQDITELVSYRIELETKIKERTKDLNVALEKEKELNELKSRFVSMASHEFRTPLSAINFAAGSIKKYWEKLDTDSRIRKLDKIEDQVKHMTNLLDDILIIGKTESGSTTPIFQLYNFNEFIQPIIDEVIASSNNTHEIILKNENADTTILIDEKLGRNIFINLLINAIKFSPGKKEVIMEVTSDNKMTQIKIIDFGFGIKEENLEDIFIAFRRGEDVESIQGSGLGLSIVKDAVNLSKGKIKVESVVGKGTTFIVNLLKK